MSQVEIDRVRETFAAFERRDAAAFKETLDEIEMRAYRRREDVP